MTWDIEAIKKNRVRRKYRRQGKRVIRINKRNNVTSYKSINNARLLNKVSYNKLKESIEKGIELNGYYYDYQ